jgi:hypothetical protein
MTYPNHFYPPEFSAVALRSCWGVGLTELRLSRLIPARSNNSSPGISPLLPLHPVFSHCHPRQVLDQLRDAKLLIFYLPLRFAMGAKQWDERREGFVQTGEIPEHLFLLNQPLEDAWDCQKQIKL